MAEYTRMRNNVLGYPIYGLPYVISFPLLDEDGDPVTGLTCDSEVSKNGNTAVDCHNEGVEIAFDTSTNKGMYYLDLTGSHTGTETVADVVAVTIYTGATTSQATCVVLYPKKLPKILSGTVGATGNDTTHVHIPDGVAINDFYNGCVLHMNGSGNDECRMITDYVASTKLATLNLALDAAPTASTSTYDVYMTDVAIAPLIALLTGIVPNAVAGAASGLAIVGSEMIADVTKIHGSALTETSGQLAAAFTTMFNVASPVFTCACINQTIDNPTAAAIQAEMEENGASLLDTIRDKLPTNYIMGSSVTTDKDDEIDAIKAQTDKLIFTVTNKVDSNVYTWKGEPLATPDTAGYPKVTIKTGFGTGEVTDTYQAKLWVFDDNFGGFDRYEVVFFKNGQPITAGITDPKIQVIKSADGGDLIAEDDLTQIGALGLYKYDEATDRMIGGVSYIAKVTATIDAGTRIWYQPVGRDSTA